MRNDTSRFSACRSRYELPREQAGNEETVQRTSVHVHLVHVRLDVGKFDRDITYTRVIPFEYYEY